jgi:hypothetical protein
MGSSEPMIPIEEKIELRWTQVKVYFPLARAKKLIPDKLGKAHVPPFGIIPAADCISNLARCDRCSRRVVAQGVSARAGSELEEPEAFE